MNVRFLNFAGVSLVVGLSMLGPDRGWADGWGTVKGRVVWTGAALPENPPLEVNKDQEWCLAHGPIHSQEVVVDPTTKGIAFVFAYLKNPPAIHPDYPQTKEDVRAADRAAFAELNGFPFDQLNDAIAAGKVRVADLKAPVMIDQVHCKYIPHAFAVREGQITLVKNPEPISHNVKVTGFMGFNDANPNMPPNTVESFEWLPEFQPLSIQCNIHPWMNMFAMVFDHPYFAVTGADGSFELKNVPAGEVTLILRNPRYIDPLKGGTGAKTGAVLQVLPGGTVDLGTIKIDDSFLLD